MAAKTAARTAPRTAPAEPPEIAGDDLSDGEDEPGQEHGLTRGVTLTGLALGVTLVTYLYSDGIHPRLPGIPAALGYLAGFAIVMLVALAIATAVSYALRWHHRDIATWSYEHGKQAVTWGYGHGRRHGGRLLGRATAWAGPRWRDRSDTRRDRLAGRRLLPSEEIEQLGQAEPCPACGAGIGEPCTPGCDDRQRPAAPAPPAADPAGVPAPAATGLDGPTVPVPALAADAPAPAATTRDGDAMTTSTAGPSAGRNRTSGRKVPAPYRAVISMIDDFTPENDAELHDLLQGVAAGEHDVGQALQDLYERCTAPDVRVGEAGMVATHNAADAVTDASGEVATASKALEQYYAGVSDEVAGGVELPKDGDFITGEGAGG